MPPTDDPGQQRAAPSGPAPMQTVRLDGLDLLDDAVSALRCAVEDLHSARAHFTVSARGLGREMGDSRLASRYDDAFARAQQALASLQQCYERLIRGLVAVADAYQETDPAVAGWGP